MYYLHTINKPQRISHKALVRSPDNLSIKILEKELLKVKELWV